MAFLSYKAPNPSRDNFRRSSTPYEYLTPVVPRNLATRAYNVLSELKTATHRRSQRPRQLWNIRRLLTVPYGLIVLWMVLIWWGERRVFQQRIDECDWNTWEHWVCLATSHLDMIHLLGVPAKLTPIHNVAPRSHSSSSRLYSRSPTSRSTYLSRSSMAVVDVHNPPYRPLPSTILFTSST